MTAPRTCGTCTACCTALGVPELKKPAYQPCAHVYEGRKGCAVYASRPSSCSEWSCMWLRGSFDGVDRPDRLGVVMDVTERNDLWPGKQALVAREAFPGGFDKASYFLRGLANHGVVILVRADGTRRLMGPAEHLKDLAIIEHHLPVVP